MNLHQREIHHLIPTTFSDVGRDVRFEQVLIQDARFADVVMCVDKFEVGTKWF